MTLTQELKSHLQQNGAALVGCADMREIPNCAYPAGVAVAIPLPIHIVNQCKNGPTEEYYHTYNEWNDRLDRIVLRGEKFLKEKGYQAHAQTTSRIMNDKTYYNDVPHKTVATRAGLGWIGKNCLLVTPEYGSAIRISSILTDAPLEPEAAKTQSECGSCNLCVDACPVTALTGETWEAGMPREMLLDAATCDLQFLERMKKETGLDKGLCGKCFAVCKFTQTYLKRDL